MLLQDIPVNDIKHNINSYLVESKKGNVNLGIGAAHQVDKVLEVLDVRLEDLRSRDISSGIASCEVPHPGYIDSILSVTIIGNDFGGLVVNCSIGVVVELLKGSLLRGHAECKRA